MLYLQSIGQSLVQAGDLRGDAKIDGTIANFDHKSADDIGINLVKVLD